MELKFSSFKINLEKKKLLILDLKIGWFPDEFVYFGVEQLVFNRFF